MKRLTEDQILEKLSDFYALINKYITGERRDKLLEMYDDLEITLSTAPASTKKDYHNAYSGGYLDHVLRVTEYALVLDKVWDRFGQNKDYTTESLVFSAINHDLGKLGYKEEPFYIPNDQDWQIKNGAYYKINSKLAHMRVADRSLFLLQQYGIPVLECEYLAIKLHDGLYEEANKVYYIAGADYAIKSNLPYILHQADLTASRLESQNK